MDFVFLGAGATNGYDALGHFLRTEGIATICVTYAIKPATGCDAHLSCHRPARWKAKPAKAARVGQHPAGHGLIMARTLACSKAPRPRRRSPSTPGRRRAARCSAAARAPGGPAGRRLQRGHTYYTPAPEESGADGMLLNYLLGD